MDSLQVESSAGFALPRIQGQDSGRSLGLVPQLVFKLEFPQSVLDLLSSRRTVWSHPPKIA